jgi:hypothetical protein
MLFQLRSLGLLIIFALCSITTYAQNSDARLTNLGPQIKSAMIQGSIFIQDREGKALIYTVVRGNPAHLVAFKAENQELILDQPLPGTDGAWDMELASDGWLYIPGAKGTLYKHFPGTTTVENLGIVLPGETTVWNLAAGKNGEIFGATYPGCRVFRYHPKDGFSDVAKGPLIQGENYVRSLVFYGKTGKLYAGVGSHAGLIELDPKTGSKLSMLPDEYKNKEFVYSLEILKGVPGGDRMLTLITNGSFTLVYNLQTRKFEYQIDEMDMKAVSQPGQNNRFYYTYRSGLYSRDINLPQQAPIKHADNVGSANALRLVNRQLLILNTDAEYLVLDLDNDKLSRNKLNVPGQPIAIQSIMKGPDGRIWSGGYLAGGHAAYDPKTNITTSYPGLHQTEGMTVKDQFIYFGIYPKGLMYEYDSHKPWDIKASNPRFLGQIPDQSRPFAVLNDAESGKIFFGMVPEYGMLGGSLVSYDTNEGKLQSHGVPEKDQSIVSLTYANHLVWAGTTVSGGLGIMPSTQEAKLFSWDVQKGLKLDEFIPVPGAKAITSMIIGPDGNIWGMASGKLFVFDPIAKKLIKSKQIYQAGILRSHVWRDAFLVLHPSGKIYGTGSNQLFRVDPKTLDHEFIEKSASLLAMDEMGRIYFHRSAELWRYDPAKE